jgi:hypothetical protein
MFPDSIGAYPENRKLRSSEGPDSFGLQRFALRSGMAPLEHSMASN